MNPAAAASRTYLVYGDNGMLLVYAGEDQEACRVACASLATHTAGHISGYQFAGRQRFEIRAYFDQVPAESFLASRRGRDLFDFAWHSDT